MSVISCQLSALEVILKFEDLEVWKRSSRLCADLYKHLNDMNDFAWIQETKELSAMLVELSKSLKGIN